MHLSHEKNMKDLLDKLVKKNLPKVKLGTVANYIPELDKAKKKCFGNIHNN